MTNSSLPVQLVNLSFTFATSASYTQNEDQDTRVLRNINLILEMGQRILLVGGNGAGKSTLLSVLAGKHLTTECTSLVFGRDAFRDTQLNLVRTYVGADWGHRSVAFASHAMAYSADMAIDEMMVQLQSQYPARRNQLLKVLHIDPKWRLHRLSDGQRRRVQLFLALIRPSKLILLDEVLGMLDLLSRENVLAFLKEESERGSTVVLATHIFDGTEEWASHVVYLRRGSIRFHGTMAQARTRPDGEVVPMYRAVESWLREEVAESEEEAGLAAKGDLDVANAQNRAGGYASGRLGDLEIESS